MKRIILGISAYYHDSAAALLQEGQIIGAAQEERFTRKKQDEGFPSEAIRYCLKQAGISSMNQVDAIVFYDKPLLKFERLLETYYVNAPKGLVQFLSFAPVWIKEKIFLKKLIHENFAKLDPSYDRKRTKLLFSEHHLSHAASAFFPSPFEEAAILTVDGVGEWDTATIMYGSGNNIKPLKELKFPHSIGLLYSAFTYFLGFKVNSGEYKLMGMAPYGNPAGTAVGEYKRKILENIVAVKDDGSLSLNQEFFDYATGLRMIREDKWERLFGFPTRPLESHIEQHHCDCALAIQQITDEIMLRMAKEAKRLTGAKNLCMAGGVALNCVSNGKILKSGIFDNVWIQPAAGDAGGALGAAYAAHHIYYGTERSANNSTDLMQGAYLGPEFSQLDVYYMARKHDAVYRVVENFDELCDIAADHIAAGKVVGWHQGRMEWGPRALGNRSIIGDARNSEMQKKLNIKIKQREGFRPFAPSVLVEDCPDFFEMDTSSPYMLLIADVVTRRRGQLPENYHALPLFDKLYHPRSDVQSITHLDFSARIQTVHKETNPAYHALISKFKEKTGYGIVVNTSFNVRGEPIVCTPEDSFRCFMGTEMDTLVIGNCLFEKEQQPEWDNKEKWKRTFHLD
jgi:carbamoyltransferase